ncbi:hypothetical protein Lal_00025427 [Lupinus albus]|nr:hypothetical protein Lal_00025427 [Lupinus albus]
MEAMKAKKPKPMIKEIPATTKSKMLNPNPIIFFVVLVTEPTPQVRNRIYNGIGFYFFSGERHYI